MAKPIDNQLISSVSKILGEELNGQKISTMLTILSLSDFDKIYSRPYTSTKWKRLDESISFECSKSKNAKALFRVIEYVAKPQNYVNSPTNDWFSLKKSLNTQLMFYGFSLNDAGKIINSEAVETFSDAQKRLKSFEEKLFLHEIHPEILKYCREELFQENYFHAIFEASKGILDRVRIISELDTDGITLIDSAFRSKNPIVLIKGNMIQSLSDKSEYSGLKSLLSTVIYFYRNPQAHNSKLYNPKSETDAITAFSMMSLAHQILDNCINVRDLN